ncbi:hypothetical protein Hsero_3700 [Herbaspirillum seropedicae SmR1]|uniref:Uncharacterized protein n=1 Tax=Herbaspirillum seropedicae (strain SmR1) TaxID=757424 RepID=D8IR52_HERSS|nr:hypothetical protein Hsero_3700 [Herbaspirillum seropedicae SmR1]
MVRQNPLQITRFFHRETRKATSRGLMRNVIVADSLRFVHLRADEGAFECVPDSLTNDSRTAWSASPRSQTCSFDKLGCSVSVVTRRRDLGGPLGMSGQKDETTRNLLGAGCWWS